MVKKHCHKAQIRRQTFAREAAREARQKWGTLVNISGLYPLRITPPPDSGVAVSRCHPIVLTRSSSSCTGVVGCRRRISDRRSTTRNAARHVLCVTLDPSSFRMSLNVFAMSARNVALSTPTPCDTVET